MISRSSGYFYTQNLFAQDLSFLLNNIELYQVFLVKENLKILKFILILNSFESDEWHIAHANNLDEENKLIAAGFEYARYSDKYDVAIYRKPP